MVGAQSRADFNAVRQAYRSALQSKDDCASRLSGKSRQDNLFTQQARGASILYLDELLKVAPIHCLAISLGERQQPFWTDETM